MSDYTPRRVNKPQINRYEETEQRIRRLEIQKERIIKEPIALKIFVGAVAGSVIGAVASTSEPVAVTITAGALGGIIPIAYKKYKIYRQDNKIREAKIKRHCDYSKKPRQKTLKMTSSKVRTNQIKNIR